MWSVQLVYNWHKFVYSGLFQNPNSILHDSTYATCCSVAAKTGQTERQCASKPWRPEKPTGSSVNAYRRITTNGDTFTIEHTCAPFMWLCATKLIKDADLLSFKANEIVSWGNPRKGNQRLSKTKLKSASLPHQS